MKKEYNKKFNSLISDYMKYGFSQMSKHDVDLLMYKYITENTNFLKNLSCYEISKKLVISTTKVKRLQLDNFLRSGGADNKQCVQDLLVQIKNGKIKPELSKDKIKFIVDDPILKQEFEHIIKELGYIVDYSFNKDVISIQLTSFLYAIKEKIPNEEYKEFEKKLLKEFRKLARVNDVLKKKVDGKSNIIEILTSVGNYFLPRAGPILRICLEKLNDFF